MAARTRDEDLRMPLTPTRRRFIQFGTAVALGTAGRNLARAAGEIGKPEKPKLTLGIPVDAATFMPIYIAAARTWKQHGLDIELLSFRGDAEVSQALAGGSVDLTLQSLDGLINLMNGGQPVKAFYAGFHQADFAWCSQPEIRSWSDAKGSSAGVATLGSLTDQLTRYVLRRHGLTPEKDVQIVQSGTTASMLQALKSRRLGIAILSPPFKWMAEEAGFNRLGSMAEEIAPSWPKHAFLAKTTFIQENPNTLRTLLRAHVAALRLARAEPETAVGALMDRLKWSKPYAERAYQEVLPGFDERGKLPDASMDVFWSIEKQGGTVKEAWPVSRLLDDRFINSFDDWAGG
jgi:NitT/TauT family transport system substrate-binding protein